MPNLMNFGTHPLGNSAHLNSDLYSRLQTLLIFVSKVVEKKDKNVISLFQKSEKSKKPKKNLWFIFEFKKQNKLSYVICDTTLWLL